MTKPSFTEISDQLGKALALVSEKKILLDKLTSDLQKANEAHNAAVNSASELKNMLDNLLLEALPSSSSQTRTR